MILGNYRVMRLLGQGGMGAVYLAEHTLLGSKAAIKVLLPDLSSKQEIVDRFFNEAKASTSINHPGIVNVFDFGYDQQGRAYLVMEFLTGESLDARLRRLGRLAVADALRITRQCASALSAAHEIGIVHRDLKPENIFLIPDPEVQGGERAKILDFGIAKLADDQKGSGSVRTRTGSMMGSPIYMSPEQCRGAGAVDYRADIYSLGCVLFRMLCGQAPFVREGIGEIIGCHLYEQAPSVRSFDPAIPLEVDSLVLRTLAKDPAQRPVSMAELAREVESFDLVAPGTGVGQPVSSTATGAMAVPAGTPAPVPGTYPPPGHSSAHPSIHPTGHPPGHPPGHPSTQPGGYPPGTPVPPTTLGGAAAETYPPSVSRQRNWPVLIAVVVLLGVGGGVTAMVVAGKDKVETQITNAPAKVDAGAGSQVAAKAAPDAAMKEDKPPPVVEDIVVQVESNPSGAAVYIAGNDEPVGTTPYRYIAPPLSHDIKLRVSKKGYEDGEVSFRGDENTTVSIALRQKRKKRPKRRDDDDDDLDYR